MLFEQLRNSNSSMIYKIKLLTIGAALGDWALTSTPPHGNTVDDVALEMECSDVIYHLRHLLGRRPPITKQ